MILGKERRHAASGMFDGRGTASSRHVYMQINKHKLCFWPVFEDQVRGPSGPPGGSM